MLNKLNLNIFSNNFFNFKKERKIEFIDLGRQRTSRNSNGIKLEKLIDKIGISKATKMAIKQSILTNICRKDFILIDGNIKLDLIVIMLLPVSILFPKLGRKIMMKFIKI